MEMRDVFFGGFVAFMGLGFLLGITALVRHYVARVSRLEPDREDAPPAAPPRFFFSPPEPRVDRPVVGDEAAVCLAAYLSREQARVAAFVSEPSVDHLYRFIDRDAPMN